MLKLLKSGATSHALKLQLCKVCMTINIYIDKKLVGNTLNYLSLFSEIMTY